MVFGRLVTSRSIACREEVIDDLPEVPAETREEHRRHVGHRFKPEL